MPLKKVKFFERRLIMEFQEYFSTQLKILEWVGLSLDKGVNFRRFIKHYAVSVLLFLAVCGRAIDFNQPFELRFEAIAMVVTHFDTLVKAFALFWHREKVSNLYNDLKRMFDAKKYNQAKLIASWRQLEAWIFFSYIGLGGVLVPPCVLTFYVLLVKNEFSVFLPVLRNLSVNEFTYIPVLLFIFFSTISSVLILLANDSMTILLLAHISHQFREVGESFRNYNGGTNALKEMVDRHCSVFK